MWGIYFRTWFKGQYVGKDSWGNCYYRQKGEVANWRTEKRWVLYKGIPEASKVPALWDAWLRHERQYTVPIQGHKGHFWEKPHLPNLTGTRFALHASKVLRAKKALPPLSYCPWAPPEMPKKLSQEVS